MVSRYEGAQPRYLPLVDALNTLADALELGLYEPEELTSLIALAEEAIQAGQDARLAIIKHLEQRHGVPIVVEDAREGVGSI